MWERSLPDSGFQCLSAVRRFSPSFPCSAAPGSRLPAPGSRLRPECLSAVGRFQPQDESESRKTGTERLQGLSATRRFSPSFPCSAAPCSLLPVSSRVPFGGEAFPAESVKFLPLADALKSPVPFGGEAFPAELASLKAFWQLAVSPVPFGGEAFPADKILGTVSFLGFNVSSAFRR